MNRDQFLDHLKTTYAEAMAIVEAKNKDYGGDSNPFKNFELVGHMGIPVTTGIFVRLCDKFARISNLMGGKAPAVADETLDDTIVDAINYLAILRAWLEHERQERAKSLPLGMSSDGRIITRGMVKADGGVVAKDQVYVNLKDGPSTPNG